jgi:signal peptide peptidase SppA
MRPAPADLAIDFLSEASVLAMDPAVAPRVERLLRAFVTGRLEAGAVVAALGGDGSAPSRPLRGSVAVVELTGVLMPTASIFTFLGIGTSLRDFMRDVRTAAADPRVSSVFVYVDSPGGSVQLVPETAALLREVRERKPVLAAVGGSCCSAAYWISANASRIDATPSGRIGSIGTFTQRVSVAKRLEREGIEWELITSSPAKAWGHEATAFSDEERRHLQQHVAEMAAAFEGDVAVGRRVALETVRQGYGRGTCLSATHALQAGMIDRVCPVDDTLARVVAAPAVTAMLDERRTALAAAALAAPRAALTRALLAGPRAALARAQQRRRQLAT